jgi:ribosome-associated translation inhibitor RaiA
MNNNMTQPTSSSTQVRFSGLPASKKWHAQVQAFLASMKGKARVDRAEVKLQHSADQSPGYTATVHLEVPGPDLKAEQKGATLLEAWHKVCAALKATVRHRDAKRAAARKRSEPRRAACA